VGTWDAAVTWAMVTLRVSSSQNLGHCEAKLGKPSRLIFLLAPSHPKCAFTNLPIQCFAK